MSPHKTIIGIFDSGCGGLPVVTQLRKLSSADNTVNISVQYLGDTRNFPYGTKTKNELKNIVRHNIQHLFDKNCSLIGIACNTASVIFNSDPVLKNHPQVVPIINLSAQKASQIGKKNIHIIASKFTIKQHSYKKLIQAARPGLRISERQHQDLINAIENQKWKIVKQLIKKVVDSIPTGTDTLVLGCTHFSLINKSLSKQLHDRCPQISLVDPSQTMAEDLISKAKSLQYKASIAPPEEINFSGSIPNYQYALAEY